MPFSSTPVIDITLQRCLLHLTMPPGRIHRLAGTEHYGLAFFYTPVHLWFQQQATQISANSLVCWAPGREQQFGNTTDAWEYSWIELSGNDVKTYLGQSIPVETVIPLTHYATLYHLLRLLDTRNSTASARQDNTLALLLLLRYLQRCIAPDDSRVPNRILEAVRYIEMHYMEKITLEHLAETAGISAKHFQREFKKYYPTTPMDYVITRRLQHAEWLMFDESLSLSEIALCVGYNDAYYFSNAFHTRYGISPSEYRKQLNMDARPARRYALQTPHEIDAFFRETWVTVYSADFSKVTTLDPRFTAVWRASEWPKDLRISSPECIRIEQGCLRLCPHPQRCGLVWQEDIAEEIRIDVVLANSSPEGLNIGIAISGDMEYGYQLRLAWFSHLEIESSCHGDWEVLQSIPYTFSPKASSYRVSFWRSDNMFYVAIDGKQVAAFYDPAAPRGPRHRTFAITRYFEGGSADIRSIQVFKRQDPLYVDVLEPGRTLLRLGMTVEAQQYISGIASSRTEPQILWEAQYLIAITETDIARREALLQTLIAEDAHPFRHQAMELLIVLYFEHDRIREGIDHLVVLNTETARRGMTPHTEAQLRYLLQLSTPAQRDAILHEVARAPLTHLHLYHCGLDALDSLAGAALTHVFCNANQITSLEPLRNMPLQQLDVSYNRVTDLSPLTGMPLRILNLTANPMVDLMTLPALPLERLDCAECRITAMPPLTGRKLRAVTISDNAISDLTPLSDAVLFELLASFNQITSLTALTGMPLRYLDLSSNPLQDLTPLSGAPLQQVHLDNTLVADLTALHNAPLHVLSLSNTTVDSLMPLAHKEMHTLHIGNAPLTNDNLQVLATLPLLKLGIDQPQREVSDVFLHLRRLRYLNNHRREYLAPRIQPMLDAYFAWRGSDVHAPVSLKASLRRHAVRCGTHDYFAFPFHLSRAEAFDFARYLGGYPACPATEEEHQALTRWLRDIIDPASTHLYYHLGLTCTPMPKWASGAVYEWQEWRGDIQAPDRQWHRIIYQYDLNHRTFHWQDGGIIGGFPPVFTLIAWLV